MKNRTLSACPPPMHLVGSLVLAATLAACGGGGGSDAPAPAPVAADPPAPAPVQPPAQPPVQPPAQPPAAGSPAVLIKEARVPAVGNNPTLGTNPSIMLSTDGLTVTSFGTEVNPACAAHTGYYADPVFSQNGSIVCNKRGVRANAGVRPGEFRYFEGTRLVAPQNFAFGITRQTDGIDPLCCYDGMPTRHPLTTPSMSYNMTNLGVFVNLVAADSDDVIASPVVQHYGFAIDYTDTSAGASPVVYVVQQTALGTIKVRGYQTSGFNGTEAIPMLYGDVGVNGSPVASVNFGQAALPFYFSDADLRRELRTQMVTALGVSDANATAKLNVFTRGIVTR